ncbi:MAG: hypothetical protein J0I30_08350, partial [Burkholderiales bacterium]|nr:hypothetical protein [Burkholderiales bacterium]
VEGDVADGLSRFWTLARANGLGAVTLSERMLPAPSGEEANAAPDYKRMIVDSGARDVTYTNLFSGVHANYLSRSIAAAGRIDVLDSFDSSIRLFLVPIPPAVRSRPAGHGPEGAAREVPIIVGSRARHAPPPHPASRSCPPPRIRFRSPA